MGYVSGDLPEIYVVLSLSPVTGSIHFQREINRLLTVSIFHVETHFFFELFQLVETVTFDQDF